MEEQPYRRLIHRFPPSLRPASRCAGANWAAGWDGVASGAVPWFLPSRLEPRKDKCCPRILAVLHIAPKYFETIELPSFFGSKGSRVRVAQSLSGKRRTWRFEDRRSDLSERARTLRKRNRMADDLLYPIQSAAGTAQKMQPNGHV
jgi:hypothetical protein